MPLARDYSDFEGAAGVDGADGADSGCVDVVPETAPGPRSLPLPRCMDMTTAEEVCRRIELYFTGGTARYLDANEARIAANVVGEGS